MKIISIQIGLPKEVIWNGKPILTGIFKNTISSQVYFTKMGIRGDGQADLKHHGGIEKAVYAIGLDAYDDWTKMRAGDVVENGMFGENLTLENLDERKIFIGDQFNVGEAVIEATQPRWPCFKLGIRLSDPKAVKDFLKCSRPRVYFKVVKEGFVKEGDRLVIRSKGAVKDSIMDVFEEIKKSRNL
jgi:MOSC domain-containing protein YiiM